MKPISFLKTSAVLTLCAGSLALAGGCANSPDAGARQLARETLAQVVEYEDSVRGLNRELTDYYGKNFDDIQMALLAQRSIESGVIRNQLAGDLADRFIAQGVRDSDFRDFFVQVQQAQDQARLRNAEIVGQLDEQRKTTLAQVIMREQKLKALRVRLEKLQTPPSLSDQISQLREFYEAAKDAYDEAKEKDKPATRPTTRRTTGTT